MPVIVSSLDRYVGFVAKKEMLKLKILTYWMKEMKCVLWIDKMLEQQSRP